MPTKREVLEAASRGEGCLGKAADDEPVFVLRGQDLLAPGTIDFWAEQARRVGGQKSYNKAALATDDAMEFRAWQARHRSTCKMPD